MLIRTIRFLALATIAATFCLLATGAPLAAAGENQAGAYIREDDRYIYAGNDRIELTFQKTDGRLYSLVDKTSQLDFLARKEAFWGPFNFQINITGQDEYINGSQSARFTYGASSDKDGPMLSLNWEQFRASRPTPLDIRVNITIHIPANDGLTYWSIAVTNNEALVIRQVSFPDLEGIPQLSRDENNDYLAYPSMSGLLIQDPVNNFKLNMGLGWEMFYPSASFNMQFTAYYSAESRSGLYLAAQDTHGDSKFLSAGKPASNWMSLLLVHRLPLTTRSGFTPSYSSVVGVFSGDWFDASQIYRKWAQDQDWFKNASLRRPDGAPEWFRHLSLHQWDHTYLDCQDVNQFANVPPGSQRTAGVIGAPVAIDWVGWERFGWYIDYPMVFPPKEGWPSFDSTVAGVQQLGNRVWVVPDTTSFSSRVPEWAQAKPAVILDAQGNYPFSFEYAECGQKSTFYEMCPSTKYWQDELRSLLLELAGRNVDIIQLDGFPVVPAPPCYSTTHNHTPGAPDLYAASYRALFESIKADARRLNPKVQISAEGMAEFYLGLLDSVWDPFTTGWTPASLDASATDPLKVQLIPLWHAVYHDATLIQSGISLFRRQTATGESAAGERDYYVRGLGRALVWGEVPSIAADRDLTALDAAPELAMLEYLKRIVQARQQYAPSFLTTGRMLRSPTISIPTIQLPEATDIPYTGATYPPSTSPAVLGSLWQAPNGDAGYVFTNISHDSVSFDLLIDAASTLLPPQGRYEVSLIRNGLPSVVQAAASLPVTIPVNIDPMDVVLIGVSPSGSSSSLLPAVNQGGVTEAMNFQQGVTASSWISIFGRNLSATTRDWTGAPELAQNKLPFTLDGVSVTINGKPAAVSFVSPGQVNVLSPADIGTGSMSVVVKNAIGQSAPVTVTGTSALPAFYAPFADSGGNLFVTAVAVNGDLLGKVGLDPRVKRALRPGEIVLLFGTGFGETNPAAPTDSAFTGAYPLRTLPVIRFGNATAPVAFGGIVSPGLYQFNLTVPEVADGDVPITAQIGAIQSSGKVMVSIKH